MNFKEKYGEWAIITGAARKLGLGYEFAQQLAAKGFNLLLTDILAEELAERQKELEQGYNVEVKTIALDLSKEHFISDLLNITKNLKIGLLICNHMYITPNTPTFLDDSLDNHLQIININARAYMILVHTYGRILRKQNKGGIILVSSMGGLHGTPFTAHYSANKAYQLMLGESIWYELKDTNVDTLVLTPGLTNTYPEGMKHYNKNMLMQVKPVITEALNNLGKKHHIVPGRFNKITSFFLDKILSRRKAIEIIGKNMEEGLQK